MNEVLRRLGSMRPLDLAGEPDFVLGPLLVQPNIRQVSAGEQRKIVEPRVMQALVVLARADGAVLSRDELIRQCWGGRVVGDDAINSCIAKIRQLSGLGDGNAFEVETIPRIGYRLIGTTTQPGSAAPAPAPSQTKIATDAALDQASAVRFVRARFGLLAAFAAGTVAAIAAAFLLMPKPAEEWSVVESHQPFISTPEIERYPSFSPDGTMIAYSRGKNDWSRQIFLQLRRGGEPLQLTHDKLDDTAPAFSPDGTSVAYAASETKQPCRIMLAQVPAGPSRQIGRCHSTERTSLAWDRGGHALFYYDRFSANQLLHIVRYDIDTGALTEITRSGEAGSLADFQPQVSPDGRTILFMRYVTGDRLQVVLRGLGSGSERVLVDDGADKYAVWSDDSTTVFVARNEGSDSSLLAYPVSGAAPWRITSNARPMEFLSSGPDGLLAVELKNRVTQLSVASPAANEAPLPLDTNGFSGCSFDYARDGTFALVTNDGESPIIAVGTPGHLHEVLRLKEHVPCGIHWSPDRTRLAFGGGDSGSRISVITRAGMPVAQVPYPSDDFGYFEWTADGKGFLQMRLDAHGWRVWRVGLAPPFKARPILPYGWNWVRVHNAMILGDQGRLPRHLAYRRGSEAADGLAVAGARLGMDNCRRQSCLRRLFQTRSPPDSRATDRRWPADRHRLCGRHRRFELPCRQPCYRTGHLQPRGSRRSRYRLAAPCPTMIITHLRRKFGSGPVRAAVLDSAPAQQFCRYVRLQCGYVHCGQSPGSDNPE